MSKRSRGIRIGSYRIKPLGIVALAVIILGIAALVIMVGNPGGVGDQIRWSINPTPTPTPVPTPTPSPTPVPTPTPAPTPRTATIRSLGEIAIQNNLLKAAESGGEYNFEAMFSNINDVMERADLTVADVEGSLCGTTQGNNGAQLLTPPSLIQTLKDCGVDMLNLANDHALDGGWDGLKSAMASCQAAGMNYVGAAATQAEKDSAKVFDINGIRVGFIAYTESLNGLEKKADKEATSFGVNLVAKDAVKKVKNEIQTCRNAGAEIIVCYMSWGEMFNRDRTDNQMKFAQNLVELGVDVIIGYNPHVIQPAYWIEAKDKSGNVIKRSLCLFSAGNLLSDSQEKYSDSGIIFQFTLQEKADYSGVEVVNPQYIPTYVWRIDKGDGLYDYRALAVGQWLDAAPESMSYTTYSRMKEVWAEAQSVMGTDVATVIKE